MKFDFLIPYIQYIVYVLIGLILLYLRTLVKERAKIRVLRKKNKLLTEETEEIKSKYNKEIEIIKNEKVNAEWALKKVVSEVKSMFKNMSDSIR